MIGRTGWDHDQNIKFLPLFAPWDFLFGLFVPSEMNIETKSDIECKSCRGMSIVHFDKLKNVIAITFLFHVIYC